MNRETKKRTLAYALYDAIKWRESLADAEGINTADRRDRICTSIVERSNLSLRMGTRRCTRLTNAFSKKWENHWASMSLWYTFYNFCRVHKSLRVTPAMEAGVSNHVWSLEEIVNLLN